MTMEQAWTWAVNEPPPEDLPFSPKMQASVLGYLLTDKVFFLECRNAVQPGWFQSSAHQKLWESMVWWYGQYQTLPTKDELLEFPTIRIEDPKTKTSLVAAVGDAVASMERFRLETIRDAMQSWMEARLLYVGIKEAAASFSSKKVGTGIERVRVLAKELAELKFQASPTYDFTAFDSHFAETERELENALTFGMDAIDRQITPQATSGALLRGDMTVLLAPMGGGKTTTLCNIACHNALRGAHVLLVTHEGRPREIEEKIFCIMCSQPELGLFVTKKDLVRAAAHNPKLYAGMKAAAEYMRTHLVYQHIAKVGLTIEEATDRICRANDEHRTHYGRGFDLIVDDYPARIGVVQTKGMERRHADNVIYTAFDDLAGSLNCHVVGAAQTNRAGYKAAHGRVGFKHRLMQCDDIEEAWGPMQKAANVLTANWDSRHNTMTYLLGKTRNNLAGIAVTCRAAMGSSISHHEALGCVWYHGDMPLGERTEALLEQFRGQEIPQGDVPRE